MPPDFSKIHTACSSSTELLEQLQITNGHWDGSQSSQWVFRGHADATWRLVAKSYRDDGWNDFREFLAHGRNTAGGIADRTRFKRGAVDRERFEFLVSRANSELRAVSAFADLADELAHPVRQVDVTTDRFAERMVRVASHPADNWFELVDSTTTALAQHHGVPTRLLDWTRRPYFAAFFAAVSALELIDRAKSTPGRPEFPSHFAVWAIDVDRVRKNKACGIDVITCPRHGLGYLHAQDGLFTHDKEFEGLYLHGQLRDVAEVLMHHWAGGPSSVVRLFTVPFGDSERLVHMLWKLRISYAHLMPTLDNVKRSLMMRDMPLKYPLR